MAAAVVTSLKTEPGEITHEDLLILDLAGLLVQQTGSHAQGSVDGAFHGEGLYRVF